MGRSARTTWGPSDSRERALGDVENRLEHSKGDLRKSRTRPRSLAVPGGPTSSGQAGGTCAEPTGSTGKATAAAAASDPADPELFQHGKEGRCCSKTGKEICPVGFAEGQSMRSGCAVLLADQASVQGARGDSGCTHPFAFSVFPTFLVPEQLPDHLCSAPRFCTSEASK